jgi:single-strand DNA-binding protein
MSGVNKVILVGNLGADPEVKRLEGGITVAKIRIATSEVYKKPNGERVDKTEWHSISLWRGLGETAEKYLKKGSKVYIEGKLRSREYTDKEGVNRRAVEIEAENMVLLDSRKSEEGGGSYADNHSKPAASHDDAHITPSASHTAPAADDDDLPF